MPFFVTIAVLFCLAAFGIWFYFTQTKSGRAQNIGDAKEEAYLQDKFMDAIEETHAVQNSLKARIEALNKE